MNLPEIARTEGSPEKEFREEVLSLEKKAMTQFHPETILFSKRVHEIIRKLYNNFRILEKKVKHINFNMECYTSLTKRLGDIKKRLIFALSVF